MADLSFPARPDRPATGPRPSVLSMAAADRTFPARHITAMAAPVPADTLFLTARFFYRSGLFCVSACQFSNGTKVKFITPLDAGGFLCLS